MVKIQTGQITRRGLFGLLAAAPAVALIPAAKAETKLVALDNAFRVSPKVAKQIIDDAAIYLGLIAPGQCMSKADADYCERVAERVFWNWPPAEDQPDLHYRMVHVLVCELAPAYFNFLATRDRDYQLRHL